MAGPYDFSGLLQQAYQDPMQGALGGASRAVAPMMGYTDRPVSMGQMIAAAGGGAVQGRQGAIQGNMNMAMVQQKMQEAQAAKARAAQQQQAIQAMAANNPQYADMINAGHGAEVAKALTRAPAKPVVPKMSPVAVLAADLKEGRITQAQFDAEMAQRAKSGVNVNIDTGEGGNVLSPGAGKRIGELWGDIDTSTGTIDKAESMIRLAERTPTGLGAEWKSWATQVADLMGFDVDMASVSNIEQFRAMQMNFVMDRIAGTKGSISEKEMEAFKQSGPNLGNTPSGNIFIAKVMAEQARREQELGMIEIDLLNKGVSRTEAFKAVERKRQEFRKTPFMTDEEIASVTGVTPASATNPANVPERVWDAMPPEHKALFKDG